MRFKRSFITLLECLLARLVYIAGIGSSGWVEGKKSIPLAVSGERRVPRLSKPGRRINFVPSWPFWSFAESPTAALAARGALRAGLLQSNLLEVSVCSVNPPTNGLSASRATATKTFPSFESVLDPPTTLE